ncbi:50S ribosomal protein L5 [Candidatus Gromoviella agglomerans]|uniref:50S ribosomal protein L5 n=1 Tax=Candidatus Gromoviella agglomerans TaxID=2806609 RepID=UPI001E58A603|nr:50S ribosomal protein L5 [Candidatus Gromoviella agglomerans]UFX98571.1 50S ribosomal protein L5 [Candidatus Gromoviella agglomerans]
MSDNVSSYLRNIYETVTVPALREKFGYGNLFQVPKIVKVSLTVGVSPKLGKDVFENVSQDLRMISGQSPMICKARRSIAGFGIREGMNIGVMVTLRGNRMYNFLEKLIYYALPRVRDFKGFSSSGFDGNGNYSFGLPDRHVFLEANSHLLDKPGISVTIVTNSSNDVQVMHMLQSLGIPFISWRVNG